MSSSTVPTPVNPADGWPKCKGTSSKEIRWYNQFVAEWNSWAKDELPDQEETWKGMTLKLKKVGFTHGISRHSIGKLRSQDITWAHVAAALILWGPKQVTAYAFGKKAQIKFPKSDITKRRYNEDGPAISDFELTAFINRWGNCAPGVSPQGDPNAPYTPSGPADETTRRHNPSRGSDRVDYSVRESDLPDDAEYTPQTFVVSDILDPACGLDAPGNTLNATTTNVGHKRKRDDMESPSDQGNPSQPSNAARPASNQTLNDATARPADGGGLPGNKFGRTAGYLIKGALSHLADVKNLQQEISGLRSTNADLVKKIGDLAKMNDDLVEKTGGLLERNRKLGGLLDNLKAEHEDLVKKHDQLEAENDRLRIKQEATSEPSFGQFAKSGARLRREMVDLCSEDGEEESAQVANQPAWTLTRPQPSQYIQAPAALQDRDAATNQEARDLEAAFEAIFAQAGNGDQGPVHGRLEKFKF